MQFFHLITLEWKKFHKNTVMILLMGLFTFLMPFAIFVMENYKSVPPMPEKDTFFTFPGIWEYQGYSASWFSFLFLGFIGVLLITTEVGNRTLRQNIITGLTRMEYFLGKLYVILLISLYATLIYFVSTLLIGSFYPETFAMADFMNGHDWSTGRYFLLTFGYLSFGLFLGYILRKTGLAIFVYLSYIIFLEPLLRWAVHIKIFNNASMHYYPMNAMEDLMPNPLFKFAENFTSMTDFNILLSYRDASIVAVISIALFLLIGLRSLLRRDI
jgi:ABC-2 type transport system permease protein